ncbi:hypothetical protein [Oceaniglobus indicus]|uniref:hypothetical protein n=1 Tax=Oceaniglobus indicus TaxID=2047749 RepID=UPI000C1A3B30|nr:hypothetical protein [Oceaniglobus indicus]
MAEDNKSGNAMPFIVGGLVVAVAVIAYVLFATDGGDTAGTGGGDVNVTVEGAGDAADNAPDAVEESTGN